MEEEEHSVPHGLSIFFVEVLPEKGFFPSKKKKLFFLRCGCLPRFTKKRIWELALEPTPAFKKLTAAVETPNTFEERTDDLSVCVFLKISPRFSLRYGPPPPRAFFYNFFCYNFYNFCVHVMIIFPVEEKNILFLLLRSLFL